MTEYVVAVTRPIAAPASAIFALLADPAKHSSFDGSGTVRRAVATASARLTLGARFGMDMRLGLPYRITNTVVEFEEGRRIAWRHVGGHVWRYRLEPSADGMATVVTEEFDWTNAGSRLFIRLVGYPERNRRAIEATLARLDALVTRRARPEPDPSR